jgi:hypothetical protein
MTITWERDCEREPEVRDMARRVAQGKLADASLSDHVASCRPCQETLNVARWMQQLASVPAVATPLPDPTYLWWKAELLRRWDAEQRAAAPVEVGEQVQVGLGLAAAAVLLVWLWRNLPDLSTSPISLATAPLAIVMTLSGIVLAATGAVMVRNLIRREEQR